MEAEFDGFTFILGASGKWVCWADGVLPDQLEGKFETVEEAEQAVRRYRARELVDEIGGVDE